jgi:LacI family transcriptional regulator
MVSTPSPTIRDVAALAKVSIATASNVLSANRPTSSESRRRVLEATEALGYRRNVLASGLREKRSRLIGIVVPDVTNVFFASLVHRLEELASAAGYEIALVTSNEQLRQERTRIEALIARQIDGLIIIPCQDLSLIDHFDGRATRSRPPIVLLDRGFDIPGYDAVSVDNEAAAYEATSHLVGLGHQDIAALVPFVGLSNMRERIAGYRRALSEAGLVARARVAVGGASLEGLRGAIEQELRRVHRPSAVLAMSNVATLGAVKAVRALDMDIPGDVSIVSFDDFDWMTALRPYVTAVAQPIDAIAEAAWERLAARMGQDGPPAPSKTKFPCRLRVRESTGPFRRRSEVTAA